MDIKRNRISCYILCSISILLGICMWNSKITYANERTIPVGITIEDIDVGEMTYDEAMKAVNSFIAQYTDRVFELLEEYRHCKKSIKLL